MKYLLLILLLSGCQSTEKEVDYQEIINILNQ